MNKKSWLSVLLALCTGVLVAGFAVGCTETDPDNNPDHNPDDNPTQTVAPTSISVTNETTQSAGAFTLTVSVMPAGADASFTSTLLGEHVQDGKPLVSLFENEVAISTAVPDGYEFTVEVASVKAPSVKSQATFTASNRPAEGLHITTAQRTVDAEQNEGKLQLSYTMFPEAEVTFSLLAETEGVSVSESGFISLDKYVDNGITFTVKAESEADGKDYSTTVEMTVKNEIEREISTEAELLAIWKSYDDAQSLRNMKNFYKLTDNIRLSSAWKAIGFQSDTRYARFEGSFNGNGYTISNFNMNAGWNSGFFYVIGEEGIVKNLTLQSGKNAGEGLTGLFSGPFAGKVEGKIINCIADVRVQSAPNGAGVYQPVGTFVGAIETTGRIINCISIGQAYDEKPADTETVKQDNERWSGFVTSVLGTFDVSVRSCYALAGSAKYAIGHHTSSATDPEGFFKTAEELKAESTYATVDEAGIGFDRDIWRIVNGAMPTLKNEKVVEPVSINVTFGGELLTESALDVRHGGYAVTAEVLGANGTENVPQAFEILLVLGSGVEEGAFYVENGTVYANTLKASDGDKCTVTVCSSFSPSVKKTVELTFKKMLSIIAELPEHVEYKTDANTFDLNALGTVTVLDGSASAKTKFELANEPSGVSLSEAGLLTLTAESDNTAVIEIVISVSDGGISASTEKLSVQIVNKVPKEIATKEQFLSIWSGGVLPDSLLHMHNNYVLTANIDLEGDAKMIGTNAWESGQFVGNGLFGTLDGNGHTVSWTNTVSVGWNSGFIARIEEGGAVKNLTLVGKITGVIAGPVGYVGGTVENCLFKVDVVSTNAGQPNGSAVAIVAKNGVVKNVLALGAVTGNFKTSAAIGKVNDDGSADNITECYALAGNVSDTVAVLTEAQMKSAATFAGWNSEIWRIHDGAIPMLRYEGLQEPTSITATVMDNGGDYVQETSGEYVVSIGEYRLNATVLPAGAPQGWAVSAIRDYDGEEGGVVKTANGFKVTAIAKTGEAFTLDVYADAAPAVKVTLTFKIRMDEFVAELNQLPETFVYAKDGTNEYDVANYITVAGGSGNHVVSLSIESAEDARGAYTLRGITTDGSKVKLTIDSDNTAKFTLKITVTDGGNVKNLQQVITVENKAFKQIATAEDFLAIWNTEEKGNSMLHMNNNYILTADIYAATIKPIGFGIDSKTADGGVDGGYGLFGILDGNGYTLSWGGEPSVGWNNGIFAKVESTGVIKNLKMKGSMSGVIAGPIGVLDGRVENCLFEVAVRNTQDTINQGTGSAVGSIRGNGKMVNCISVGMTRNKAYENCCAKSAMYGQINSLATGNKNIGENNFVLEGTVENEYGNWATADNVVSPVTIVTEAQMKTAATFADFDDTVWSFTDGELPKLNNGCSLAE